jgi:hypothetical protein
VWLQWTNHLPSWFADLNFIKGNFKSDLMKSIWNRTNPRGKWPKARLVKTISLSEYGVVLVDFKNGVLFSRQNYCSPGILGANHYGSWESELILSLAAEKRLLGAEGYPHVRTPKSEFRKRKDLYYLDKHEEADRTMQPSTAPYHQTHYSMSPLEVDHNSTPPHDSVRYETRTFLEKNGWKTAERITKE